MNLTVAKQMSFDYFARLQSTDLIVHPGMKALKTFNDYPEKIVSAVNMGSQCPSNGQAFANFIKDILQYSEHLFMLGDPTTCPLYKALMISKKPYVTTLVSDNDGIDKLAEEISKSSATHVVSVAPGELFSKDFTNSSLLRQFILSLEPGEALDAFSLDKKEYVPVAFALDDKSHIIKHTNGNTLTLTDAYHYKVLPGVNLPEYPSYYVHKGKNF